MPKKAKNTVEGPKIETIEVIIVGTKPLITIPLGCFKNQPEDAIDQLDQALELYELGGMQNGFPAGGIKRAMLAACKDYDKDVRNRIAGAVIMGDPMTNLVPLEGESEGEEFEFTFKRPKREVKRTLPIFKKWSISFEVLFNSRDLSQRELLEILGIAGTTIGLGHNRPDNGTFAIAKHNKQSKSRTGRKAA